MNHRHEPIRRLLASVRSQHRAITIARAVARVALCASAVIALVLAANGLVARVAPSATALLVIAVLAVIGSAAFIVWALRPLRTRYTDADYARLIEERVPSLDDRLATAVDVLRSPEHSTAMFVEALLDDASRQASAIDVDQIVPAARVRKSRLHALASTLALVVVLFFAREPIRQTVDAASLKLFPVRVTLEVTPGDAHVREGMPLPIRARLIGNRAPAAAQLHVENDGSWHTSSMRMSNSGQYESAILDISRDFRYRVVVGSLVSPLFRVRVTRPPRVARIDVDYKYPASLGIPPHTETDAGDIYAPAGTDVRLHVYTDQHAESGQLTLNSGASIAMSAESPTQFTADMTLSADGSYRVVLAGADGLGSEASPEYFIRVVTDRPPEVHISKPASDRQVTSLEEVEIEAQADDDYGLDRVELVYAIRGEAEHVVPLSIPAHSTAATVHHTMFLEDMRVQPGDFVSYYVRARDVTRGGASTRSNEGRSDIFFLEVRPFEQEFSLAESQSMAGSGYNGSIDDLVSAQKQVVVATWKIDRRTQASRGAQPGEDIRTIGRGEADLLTRAEEVASSFRESTMRDPRKRLGRSSDPSVPEEQAMSKAVDAMGRAVTALNGLHTGAALPPEMQALNALLEAQALVKRRQISRQQTAQGGPGNDNRNYDVSTLFDKELQQLEETNYETRQPSGEQPRDSLADALKTLARRQDELLRREQQLQSLGEADRKRELEKLTREQAALRQQAEELTKSMARDGSSTTASAQLRDIARDMEGAANDLRRQDATSSQSRGRQALDKLQRLSGADGNQRDLNAAQRGSDSTGKRLQEALGKAQALRQKLDALTRDLQQVGKERRMQAAERTRLQQEAARQLQETRDLVGPGFTYEGQGMTFSAPGTEAFKQDVSRWESLQLQATRALEQFSASVSQRLTETNVGAIHAAAGVDEVAPPAYRAQVDAYFKAIAAKKSQ